jgi:copper oxidase (laccase) domain-containing protein
MTYPDLTSPPLPTVHYNDYCPRISYACNALNTVPNIEAVFGTCHMGPFTSHILGHHPHWDKDKITMPIESEQAGGHCAIITSHSTHRPHANGLVTIQKNHTLIGYGADCPGILASNKDGSVIGMFHASWWAQADHGIARFIDAFAHYGVAPHDIHATIGPSIAKEHYKITLHDHFYKRIKQANPVMQDYLDTKNLCFDVRGSTEGLLREQGVTHIHHIALDTFSHKDKNGEAEFFSARRGRPANHNNPWAIRIKP